MATETYRQTLPQIQAELDQVIEAIDTLEEGDELAESVREAVVAYLSGLKETRAAKLDAYADMIRMSEARAANLKEEAKLVRDLAASAESRAKRLKRLLECWLQTQGIDKYETPLHAFRMQAASVKPLLIDEGMTAEEADEQYIRRTCEFDFDAIKKAIEAGIKVPWARIGEAKVTVRIR